MKKWLSLLVLLTIVVLVFNPKYKYSYVKLGFYGYESYHQFHHVNFFIAPIHETLTGKTLMVDVKSQYGVLLTYLLSLIFRFFPLTYSNFILLTTAVTIIYYFIFYLFIKKATNSYWIAIFGLIALLKLAFFRDLRVDQEIFILPSTTPIRFFFDIIIVYLLYGYFLRKNRQSIVVSSVAVILALFYNFDFGFPIFIAYVSVLFLDTGLSLLKHETGKIVFKKIIAYLLPLEIFFILTAVLISLFTFLRSGFFPDWSLYFKAVFIQIFGLKELSPLAGAYYLPLFIYLAGYYLVLAKLYLKDTVNIQALFFLVVYGSLIFVYAINLKEPNHLATAIHPAILVLCLLLAELKDKVNRFAAGLFFVAIFVVIFGSPGDFITRVRDKLNYRYSPLTENYHYWNYPGTDFYLTDDNGANFYQAANKIKQLVAGNNETLIISRYDSLLYLMSGKASLINHPIIEYDVYTVSEYNQVLRELNRNKPPYVFVHSKNYNQFYLNTMDLIWDKLKPSYVFQEQAGAVDVYKLR